MCRTGSRSATWPDAVFKLEDGKTQEMYCEGNRLHGIKNTGPAPMRFYFFKWMA